MYTAMLTVENIHGAHHDIWSVNVEEEYHETSDTALRLGRRRNRPRRADHPPRGRQGRERRRRTPPPSGGGHRRSRPPPSAPLPWWIAAACAVGLALRLVYAFVVKSGAPLGKGDAFYYHGQAQLNVDGHWFVDPITSTWPSTRWPR